MNKEEHQILIDEFRSAHDIADHVDYLIAIYLSKSVDGAAQLMKCSTRTVQNHVVWITEAVGKPVLKEGGMAGTKARLSAQGIKIVKQHLPLVQSRMDNLSLFKNKSQLSSSSYSDVVKQPRQKTSNDKEMHLEDLSMSWHRHTERFFIQIVPNDEFYLENKSANGLSHNSTPAYIVRKVVRSSQLKAWNTTYKTYDFRKLISDSRTLRSDLRTLRRWILQISSWLSYLQMKLFSKNKDLLFREPLNSTSPIFAFDSYNDNILRKEHIATRYVLQPDNLYKGFGGSYNSSAPSAIKSPNIDGGSDGWYLKVLIVPISVLPNIETLERNYWLADYLSTHGTSNTVFPLTTRLRHARGSIIRYDKNRISKITLFEENAIDDIIETALNTLNFQLLRAALNHEGYGVPLEYPNDLLIPLEWNEFDVEDKEIDLGDESADRWHENYVPPPKFDFSQAADEKQKFAVAVANNVHLMLENAIRQEDILGLRVLLRLYGHNISPDQAPLETEERPNWEDSGTAYPENSSE